MCASLDKHLKRGLTLTTSDELFPAQRRRRHHLTQEEVNATEQTSKADTATKADEVAANTSAAPRVRFALHRSLSVCS